MHLKSESSDDYYYSFPGILTDDEALALAKADIEKYEDPEGVYLIHIERIEL